MTDRTQPGLLAAFALGLGLAVVSQAVATAPLQLTPLQPPERKQSDSPFSEVPPGEVPGEQSADALSDRVSNEARGWIRQLGSDSYAARERAQGQLLRLGVAVVPELVAGIRQADAEQADRLVRLLAELAESVEPTTSRVARDALVGLTEQAGTGHAYLAAQFLKVFRENQNRIALDWLSQMGCDIGRQRMQIGTVEAMPERVLRIDERFRYRPQDLELLQWVGDIEVVTLEGPGIDRQVLAAVVQMPNLRVLQIRHANLNNQDLAELRRCRQLETLELLYTPIDDAAVELLADLPVWRMFRLFGTLLTAEGAGRLEPQLDGRQLLFGRGAYLGIKSPAAGPVVVDQVLPGSAAAQAGLIRGDLLRHLNDQPLQRFEDLRVALSQFAPGESVELTVERRLRPDSFPEQLKISVELGYQN
jgi:hypothetical protein